MSSNEWESASEVLKCISPQLEALPGTGIPQVLVAQLRLHSILLKALLLIQQGNIALLAKSGAASEFPDILMLFCCECMVKSNLIYQKARMHVGCEASEQESTGS